MAKLNKASSSGKFGQLRSRSGEDIFSDKFNDPFVEYEKEKRISADRDKVLPTPIYQKSYFLLIGIREGFHLN